MTAATPATWLVDATALKIGRLVPPVSKSDAQRALAIEHILGIADWSGLAASLESQPGDVQVIARGLNTLHGASEAPVEIDCEDGGAPFRILLGQAAVTPGAVVRFRGTARLRERPLGPLVDALRETLSSSGLEIDDNRQWPLTLRAPQHFRNARFRVDASQSSQFATSLFFAAASLTYRQHLSGGLELMGPVASAGYLSLTLRWLRLAGFEIVERPESFSLRTGTIRERGPPLPGDWSSLAYLFLVAWKTGSVVQGVDLATEHPDRAIVSVLEAAGLRVEHPAAGEVRIMGRAMRGIEASGDECPDLLPTLAAFACVLPERSCLRRVSILRGKESDRLAAIESLVYAFGGRAIETDEDSLEIQPPPTPPGQFAFDTRGDHRLAMSAATLAVLGGARLSLRDPECVKKSFPNFWQQLAAIGVRAAPAPFLSSE